jgi:conjugal transfer mating pair stabilization protein TraG
VLVAAFAGLFTPGRFHGWSWLIGFMLLYYGLFLPKADVVIVDKLGSQSPVVVGNVPIGVAFFGHYTSKVGDVMTRFFETAFQVIPAPNAQLPSELAYQKNGVLFGNRLIQASRRANVADPAAAHRPDRLRLQLHPLRPAGRHHRPRRLSRKAPTSGH